MRRNSQSFIKRGGTDGSEKMERNRQLTVEWEAIEREREGEREIRKSSWANSWHLEDR